MGLRTPKAKEFLKGKDVSTTSTLAKIAESFQASHKRKPIAGIDVSVWVNACIHGRNNRVREQYHACPMVPVTAVGDYFSSRIRMFQNFGWECLLVFDGDRNPLKLETNESRKSKIELDENLKKLKICYQDFEKYTIKQVESLKKKTIWPRDDMYAEVIRIAHEHQVKVVGSPYETDHQMVSLQNQGLSDFAVSTDTDFPLLGIKKWLYSCNMHGSCKFVNLADYLEALQAEFRCLRNVTVDHLQVFACLLGNDFIDKIKDLRYNTISQYMKLYIDGERCIDTILSELQHPTPQLFKRVQFFWKHAPAFFLVPNDRTISAKEAFLARNYNIELRSMSTVEESKNDEFYIPTEQKIGFLPKHNLRQLRSIEAESSQKDGTYEEFFDLIKWSRTGQALDPIVEQTNADGT